MNSCFRTPSFCNSSVMAFKYLLTKCKKMFVTEKYTEEIVVFEMILVILSIKEVQNIK